MAKREPLSRDEIDEALQELPGWRFEEDQLKKRFELENFRAAISFIVRLSFEAEQLDHHPELTNVYRTVDVSLTTHVAGDRVSAMDVELAKAIEGFTWV